MEPIENSAPAVRKPTRKTVRKPKFTGYTNEGGKAIADVEAQEQFISEFNKLKPAEKAGAIWLVRKLTSAGPFLMQGYSKMCRFLKLFAADANQVKF